MSRKKRKPPVEMTRWERMQSGLCPNCTQRGLHYIPPGSGVGGFFMCEPVDGEKEPSNDQSARSDT